MFIRMYTKSINKDIPNTKDILFITILISFSSIKLLIFKNLSSAFFIIWISKPIHPTNTTIPKNTYIFSIVLLGKKINIIPMINNIKEEKNKNGFILEKSNKSK